jgi:KaiC/GvpD/RAD55 family RecA-like ATPase
MTTFALQFLQEGLAAGDRVGLVAPMSQPSWLVEQADQYGWGFTTAREAGDLLVGTVSEVDAGEDPGAVTEEVEQLTAAGIDRLAFPNFDMYERLFETHDERLRTTRALLSEVQGSVTTFLTAEIKEYDPFQTHYRTVERVADVILETRQHRTHSRPKTSVSVRSATTSIDTTRLPYESTDDGIAVYGNASIF